MTLDMQIKFMSREITRRKSLFPKLITEGRVTEEQAAFEIAAAQAVFQTLTQLRGIAVAKG